MAVRSLPLALSLGLVVLLAVAAPGPGAAAGPAGAAVSAELQGIPAGDAPPQCSDDTDNDLDGKTDYPADPDCSSDLDDNETASPVAPEVKARVVVAVATSGSLNGDACTGAFTGGDGSALCAGSDVACDVCFAPTCGNLASDDSRLAQIRLALANLFSRDDAEFALLRAHQTPRTFACPVADPLAGSGGWQGAPDSACADGYNEGDVLVSFAPDNTPGLLAYVTDPTAGQQAPEPGRDYALRGSGTRPLAGMLTTGKALLDATRSNDAAQACRPYPLVLLTDGASDCPGDAEAAASNLFGAGTPVFVVGYAAQASQQELDAIAADGGSGSAIFVDSTADLSQALDLIVDENVLFETCNGSDDDCDNLTDEGFDVGAPCTNGLLGACLRSGERVCAVDGMSAICDAPPVQPQDEACSNDTDDDCDGFTDEACGDLLADGFESGPSG